MLQSGWIATKHLELLRVVVSPRRSWKSWKITPGSQKNIAAGWFFIGLLVWFALFFVVSTFFPAPRGHGKAERLDGDDQRDG